MRIDLRLKRVFVGQPAFCVVAAIGGVHLQRGHIGRWFGRKTPLAVLFGLATCGRVLLGAPQTEELILCGDKEVFIVDLKAGGKKVWSWLAADPPGNPRKFEPFERLGDLAEVKSADIHPRTGRIACVQAETVWWSSRVVFFKPEGEIRRRGERLYKARWN